MAEKDIAARIIDLRGDVQRAQKLRAEAEVNLNAAKKKLEEVDAALKALGLNPDNADTELTALEAQLTKTVGELQAAISKEIGAYNDIIESSKKALA
jgi:chromosome segregation ATPase